MNTLLEIDEVCASYGAIQALHNVTLKIDRGEIVTLIGANGAGKSTLLMSLFGQPRIHAGAIRFKGEDISRIPTSHVARRGIALVPEGRRIFAKMMVEENLRMGTIVRGEERWETNLERIYTLFPRLKERRFQRAGTMSGGEQQMLAIGRALMSEPELLLLDEPSLGLAPLIVAEIFRNLVKIASEGTTIFLVEQNAAKALQIAQRGYVLANGEIRVSGPSSELAKDPRVRAIYLGEGTA